MSDDRLTVARLRLVEAQEAVDIAAGDGGIDSRDRGDTMLLWAMERTQEALAALLAALGEASSSE